MVCAPAGGGNAISAPAAANTLAVAPANVVPSRRRRENDVLTGSSHSSPLPALGSSCSDPHTVASPPCHSFQVRPRSVGTSAHDSRTRSSAFLVVLHAAAPNWCFVHHSFERNNILPVEPM